MRSGRLCSSAERQVTSTWCSPLASIAASVSRASAPQAIRSVRGGVHAAHARRGAADVVAARDVVLGGLDRDRGVAAVGVGTHRVGEGLVQRRAADQDDIVVADALLLHRVDHDLHVGHGRGEQGRHAQDVGLVLLQRLQILVDVAVDAEVDHLEPGTLHHHPDQVLADVVDVALDRADHHLARRRCPGLGQQRAQDRHAALHGVGGEQHLGHEQDAVAEIDADDGHAADQRLGQHAVGRPAALEQDVDALLDLGLEAVIEVVLHLLDELVVVQRPQVEIATVLAHRLTHTKRAHGCRHPGE